MKSKYTEKLKELKLLDAFYDALGDNLTMRDLAEGVTVSFKHGDSDKDYIVNTKADYPYATKPMSYYANYLTRKIIEAANED